MRRPDFESCPGAALLAIAAGAVVSRSDAERRPRVRSLRRHATEATTAATSEVAVLAGGCFLGRAGVFQHR